MWGDEGLSLGHLEGPVQYDSSWVPGARRRVLRHSKEVADLWTGQVLWDDAGTAKSFSAIVMDYDYAHASEGIDTMDLLSKRSWWVCLSCMNQECVLCMSGGAMCCILGEIGVCG